MTGPSYWTKDGDVADLSDLYHHPKHLLSYQNKIPILHDQPQFPVVAYHDKPIHPVEEHGKIPKDVVSKVRKE